MAPAPVGAALPALPSVPCGPREGLLSSPDVLEGKGAGGPRQGRGQRVCAGKLGIWEQPVILVVSCPSCDWFPQFFQSLPWVL